MKMKTPRPKKKAITVEEFVRQLQRDPEFAARLGESEIRRQSAIQENRRVEAPIVQELRNAGYDVDSLHGLMDLFEQSGAPYTEAVPILIEWLPRISNPDVKQAIVGTLSVPWAKQAARALIEEFRKAPETPPNHATQKWTIGNALSIVADDSVFEEIVSLVRDKRHGKDREMLALALGNMRDESAVDVLIKLLEDEEVAGHALMALRKLKARKAEPYFEKFLSHPKRWVRKEAEKALKKLRSSQK